MSSTGTGCNRVNFSIVFPEPEWVAGYWFVDTAGNPVWVPVPIQAGKLHIWKAYGMQFVVIR